MSPHEKLEAVEKLKVAGNDLFKIGKFQRAAKKYSKVVKFSVQIFLDLMDPY
jgi:FK506-binding protein 4/5